MHADSNVDKVLLANKCDQNENRQVSFEEGEALAKEGGMKFFETSAKQDFNVEEAFLSIATDVKDRLLESGGGNAAITGHRLGTKDNKKTGGFFSSFC